MLCKSELYSQDSESAQLGWGLDRSVLKISPGESEASQPRAPGVDQQVQSWSWTRLGSNPGSVTLVVQLITSELEMMHRLGARRGVKAP